MPQPFKPKTGQQVTSGSSVIRQRPACAIAIVEVCGSWAHFEEMLLDLFNTVTSHWKTLPNGQRVPISNYAVLRAFKAVDTLHLKHVIMTSAFKGRLSEELIDEFEILMRTARTRVKERNAVAHALWAICDAYPDDLLIATEGAFGPTDYVRYTLKDFDNITARLQGLLSEAFFLEPKCREYAQTLPEPALYGG